MAFRSDVRTRIAQPADAETITALINRAFLVERFFIEGDRIELEQVRVLFQKGEFILAEDEAGLAGCVYIEPRGQRSYLGLLSVDPGRQRNGLGSRLIAAAEDRCREMGCRFMDLRIVNVREELPAFYGRLGYIEDGTAPLPEGSPVKQPCHFVLMSKPL